MKSLMADMIALRLPDIPDGPMNNRLYRVLRDAIFEGRLAPRTRLPASRDLSRELAIARNTVVHAYNQLLTEGYVEVRPGNGTFVVDALPDIPTGRTPHASRRPSAPALSARGERLIRDASASPHQWGAFMPGVPDVTRLPKARLAKLFRDAWRNPPPGMLTYAHGGGLPALKQALSEYLAVSRSLACTPDQIVITEGSHQAIDLTSRMLADVGDVAWVEDPGYWGARNTMRANGLQLQGWPVDADGICVPDEPEGPPPRFIFLTPSHQYPLGSVMPLSRRRRILALARKWGCWVIEDDYDSEMRFAGHPIAAMQGMEEDAPVIYMGTFSKTLYPGLRLGYMVLPEALAPAFQAAQAELYREGHYMTQTAIAHFIEQGDYARHVRRMRLLYSQRRAMLANLIDRRLGSGWLHENGSEAGLHLVIDLPEKMDDVAVERSAYSQGVLTRALSRYYLDRSQVRSGLLLGYACVPENQMAERFEKIVSALAEQLRKT